MLRFGPLLHVLARVVTPDLTKQIEYLKVENEILRSKLPKRISLTNDERHLLMKFGQAIGSAIKELLSAVTYRTFQRWIKNATDGSSRPAGQGRPRISEQIQKYILRIAHETGWGATRIFGEMKKLGFQVSRTTVRNILKEHGVGSGPLRGRDTWDAFIKRHIKTLWACDFFTKKVWTLRGPVTYYVFFYIEIATRRVHIAGMTRNPNGAWMAQQARNLCMLTQELDSKPTMILRDGDKKFTRQFDAILATEYIQTKQIHRSAPLMNAHAESWIGSLKRECLNHFIVFGEDHLRHLIDEYVDYYNTLRPHRGLGCRLIGPRGQNISKSHTHEELICEERLGGLLKSYRAMAA